MLRRLWHTRVGSTQSAIDSPILRRVVAWQVLLGKVAQAALRRWRIAPIGLLTLLAVVAGSVAVVGNVVAGIIAAILESVRFILTALSYYIAHWRSWIYSLR
jgi:hypothetical protein